MTKSEGVPLPVAYLWQILAMRIDIVSMLNQFILCHLFHVCAARTELRQAVDDIDDEVEAIHFVQDRHVEVGGDGPLFLVAADMDVGVTLSAVGQAVNEPWVASSMATVPRLAKASVTASLALDDKFIPSTTRVRAI